MKRTQLARTKGLDRGRPLERKTPLARPSEPLRRSERPSRAVRPPPKRRRERPGERADAPGKREWYDFPRYGRCEACGRYGRRHAHHVLLWQYIERIAPERIYDLANRWLLGVECCHKSHHQFGVNDRRLPYAAIPGPAVDFVRQLLGGAADRYFRARYRNAP